jgi:hypothetical protein
MATATRSSRRKRDTAASTAAIDSATSTTLTCPECGRTFSRPAALGAHRARAHGVAGSSQNARSRRNAAARNAAAARARRTPTQAPASAAARSAGRGGDGVDHDALLRTLFPNGIPPRQEIVAAVNEWLSQADGLARRR